MVQNKKWNVSLNLQQRHGECYHDEAVFIPFFKLTMVCILYADIYVKLICQNCLLKKLIYLSPFYLCELVCSCTDLDWFFKTGVLGPTVPEQLVDKLECLWENSNQ